MAPVQQAALVVHLCTVPPPAPAAPCPSSTLPPCPSSTLPPPSPSFLKPDEGGADTRSKGGGGDSPTVLQGFCKCKKEAVEEGLLCVRLFVSPLQLETAKLGGETVSCLNALLWTHARPWTRLRTARSLKHLLWKLAALQVLFWCLDRFPPPTSRLYSLTRARNYAQTRTCFPHKHVRFYWYAGGRHWKRAHQWDELGSLGLGGRQRPVKSFFSGLWVHQS